MTVIADHQNCPHTVGEDDVGHRQKAVAEADIRSGMDLNMAFALHSGRYHCHQGGNQDTNKGWTTYWLDIL